MDNLTVAANPTGFFTTIERCTSSVTGDLGGIVTSEDYTLIVAE